ncbi:TonB-dependent receptor [Paludibaculum fermentans]|uniref:TonB-dependent receptor n=1 Tax=Paludibaculum fermentans TaxID=1473598 RepID=UPI003EBD5B1E
MINFEGLARYALLASFAGSLSAADSSLNGRVTSSGIALPGTRIEVQSTQGSTVEWTGRDGAWSIGGLMAGQSVVVSAESSGFVTSRRTVTLEPGGNTTDFQLALKDLHETVVVTGGILSVRSDAPEKSQALSSEQLSELPSNGRRLMRFALLSPHVRQGIGLGGDGNDSNRLSINASSYRHTAYMLDGIVNYDWIYANGPQQTVSVSAVEQFKIVSGQYAAEFGTSTAGVLMVATKSGSNNLHGEAFALLRPSGIQAQAPLASASLARVPNEREQWGASLAGALRRDRTFYFLNYEGSSQARGAFIQSPSPSFFVGKQHEQYALAKADHRWNERNWLTWRGNGYLYSGDNLNDRIGGFNQPSYGREARTQSWGSQLNLYSVRGPLLNELHLAFVSYFPDSAFPLQSSVQISRPSYSTAGFSTNNWVHARSYDIGDVVALRRGAHQIKFGLNYIRQVVKDYSFTPFGTYTFAAGPPTSGQQPLRYSQTFGSASFRYGQTVTAGFAQDDIQLRPRLTLNLGLRYENQSITADRNNFAPRLGLAWDVRGDGRTVVRGGAAMFYDQFYLYIYRRFYSLSPFAPTAAYTLSYGDPAFPSFPASLAAPPASGATAGRRDLYIPADRLINPYSLQYSLAVERQLGQGYVLSIDGLHSHVLKQMRVNDINHPTPLLRTAPGQTRSAAVADLTRPYSTWLGVPARLIAVIENSSSSIYDALSIGLSRRLKEKFLIDFHYTAASSATYSGFYADANSGIPNEWNNWGQAERAPSDFYQRHRFAGNGLAHLPLGIQFSGTLIVGSGLPVNPLTGTDNNGDTYSSDRPLGFGRNSFRTPIQTQFDSAVSRRVRIRERLTAEFRVEVFNLLNRNNYIEVNNIYGEGSTPRTTFLQPIAGVARTDPSRQIHLGVRLLF